MALIERQSKHKPGSVYQIVLIQLGVTLLLSLAGLWFSVNNAISVLLGGLICVISSAVFIWRFFKGKNNQSPQALLRNAYLGEMAKILITALLFSLVLIFFENLKILLLFAGFISAQAVYWLAPVIFKRPIFNKT